MRRVAIGILALSLTGCITPHQELSGKWVKPAKVEERSAFGTNHGFARLERCDGPEHRKPWYRFYTESDFDKCVYLTKAEHDEWEGDQSRGAGPEIAGAVVSGATFGTVVAVTRGGNAVASAGSSATNTAIQTVGKHRR